MKKMQFNGSIHDIHTQPAHSIAMETHVCAMKITTTVQLPCTIGEARVVMPAQGVACVADARGVLIGVVDEATLTHAIALGFGEMSLAQCLWQLPTRRMSVYTPNGRFVRVAAGYAYAVVATDATDAIAWLHVRQSLPDALADVLAQIATIARQHNAQLFVVGGAVRSVLQSAPITDLDVAMNGDMAVIGPAIAQQLVTTIIQRSLFDTATLAMPAHVVAATGISSIDIVPLRTETYTHPGALPVVYPATSIVRDLGRRDLTINAMAIAYQPDQTMPLYDPFAGRDDLLHRRARILHPMSLIDDPTRLVRLARFMARLQLHMDETTRQAIRWAVDAQVIRHVSRQRWINEIQRILDEVHPHVAWAVLRRWGVLNQIDPVFVQRLSPHVQQLPSAWRIIAVLWSAPLAPLIQFMARWHEAPKPLRGIVTLRQTRRQWRWLQRRPPSQVVAYLRAFDRLLLTHVAAFEPQLAALVQRADTAQATMGTLMVRGDDLVALGLPKGANIGRLLQALHDALIDGAADMPTHDMQIAWLMRHPLWP